MSVLGVGVLEFCSARLCPLQLLQANCSFLSPLLRMRRQEVLSFSWVQLTSSLAGRRNSCSHGVFQMSHPGKVVGALMYLIQMFTANQQWLLIDSS